MASLRNILVIALAQKKVYENRRETPSRKWAKRTPADFGRMALLIPLVILVSSPQSPMPKNSIHQGMEFFYLV
ncbi:hypothetical protein [aff. Roholtiella sp. LEGE 12411]|uniref:hypothetical protein n=1 Tax=aff. Roholtiella sp. LEGE 12411 TaxID=1828822 RepID=UPI00187E0693|nr:hypothetical protein [aff. Roholtiella sp. LEGE 12411]